ncbi:MAG: hypothetical protein U1E02_06140, partial [Hydrogenophaga sp.]|nr:hypothetical protein [Hydrogenophaga sp.]
MNYANTIIRGTTSICLLGMLSISVQCAETSHLHDYFWFNYQLAAGKVNEANAWFTKNLQTAPVHVYKGYTQLLHATGKHQAITALIPKLDAHFATDPDIQLIFYQALAHTGNTQRAHELLMNLSQQFKSNQEIAYMTAQAHLKNHETSNALSVINDYLNSTPPKSSNFVFHFLKAQILTQLDKKTEALASVTKSVRMQPLFDAGWLLRAVLEEQLAQEKKGQEQAKQTQEAIKAYISYLELAGGNDMVEKHLLSIFFKQKV